MFVYRVFGDWTGILDFGGPFDAKVFEVAFHTKSGSVVLTTTYANAEQVHDLAAAANAPLRVTAPFPTGVPEL